MNYRIRQLPPLMLCAAAILTSLLLAAKPSDVAGTWRGESLCTGANPGCHEEKVVYYISDIPNQPDVVTIQADKIVDGKAITMGTGPWQYDRAQHTLEWRTDRQVWLLRVAGNRIDGTLTRADHAVVRKMTLTKGD